MNPELALIRNEQDTLFIAIPACGITPVLLMMDAVTHYKFKDNPHTYITLDAAIDWHQNQFPFIRTKRERTKRREFIETLLRCRDKPRADYSKN
jgi:hypothetical protein